MISSQYQFHMKERILRLGKVVLMALALTVGFFSCEKKEDVAPVVQNSGTDAELVALQASLNSANASMMRVQSGYYTVAQRYKNNYSHRTHWHPIAQGFTNWWNCIASADRGNTISVQDVLELGEGREKTIDLVKKLVPAYPGLQHRGYSDLDESTTAQGRLEGLFTNGIKFNRKAPVAVLIKSKDWKNSLVTVLSYKDGYVYYYDPFYNGLQDAHISTFASNAKAASESGNVINVIFW